MMGVAGGVWFNNSDPFSHVREYKRWKTALKETALEFHAVEIMRVGLCEEKEPNPHKHFRPWERGDDLATAFKTCSQEEYKAVLGKLLKKKFILANEVIPRTPITMVKRQKRVRRGSQ